MNRRNLWLLGGASLLVVAGWVLTRSENAGKAAQRRAKLEQVQFPRYPRHGEYERMQRRRTLPPLPPAAEASPSPQSPPSLAPSDSTQRRDPLLSAMGGKADVAIVFEAGSFRRMPLGELLLGCLERDSPGALEELRTKTGIDTDSVDRVAMTTSASGSTVVMASAKVDPEKFASLLPNSGMVAQGATGGRERSSYGDKGIVFAPPQVGDDEGKHGPSVVGVWSDSLILLGDSKKDIEAAIDRVEGRGAAFTPAVPSEMTYGEIYGHVRASYLAKLLPPELEAVAKTAEDVELHVDATEDALIVAEVNGRAAAEMNDLARTLGGALSAARITARAQGDHDMAELLDLARVTPNAGSFTVEAAFPIEVIKRRLGECARQSP